jgi:hypothetical protein
MITLLLLSRIVTLVNQHLFIYNPINDEPFTKPDNSASNEINETFEHETTK